MKKLQKRMVCMITIIMLGLTIFSIRHTVFAAGETNETEGGQTEGSQTEDSQSDDKKIGWQEIEGKRYYFDEDGVMQTGWLHLDDQWYYLGSPDDGAMRADCWEYVYGKCYYFNEHGVMQTGWVKWNGYWYYLGGADDGAMRVDCWEYVYGRCYYFGKYGEMKTGWVKWNGYWYYLGGVDDGAMRVNCWEYVCGRCYYFGKYGEMKTGWIKWNGYWYYLGGADDGAMRVNGWEYVYGRYYYFGRYGEMKTGWVKWNDYWYYLGGADDGAMRIGAQYIDGYVYVFANSGAMYENGTYYENGARFSANRWGVITSCQLYSFPVIKQMPELPTGCEVTALTMAMHYYGYPVSKMTMATTYLPQIHGNLYGVDLDEYFGGNPCEKGTVCGPGALVTAANRYFIDNGYAMRGNNLMGYGVNELYTRVANGQPIVVMSTIGMANRRKTTGWYTSTGKYVDWSTNDHGSVLIGWDQSSVIIACPLFGIQTYSKTQFEKVYASRGYRGMTIQ